MKAYVIIDRQLQDQPAQYASNTNILDNGEEVEQYEIFVDMASAQKSCDEWNKNVGNFFHIEDLKLPDIKSKSKRKD